MRWAAQCRSWTPRTPCAFARSADVKEAVFVRSHLAAALNDYLFSLHRTGSALSSFAGGKLLSVAQNPTAVSPDPQPDDVKVEEEESEGRATEAATEAERKLEEVQSRDSGDSYSARSSPKEEKGMRGEGGDLRSETGTRMNFGSSMLAEIAEDAGSSAATYKTGEIPLDNKKMVMRREDLKGNFDVLGKDIENVAEAGNGLNEMLKFEWNQQDQSFNQLKKTMCHSSSVLSKLCPIWTSKPLSVDRCQPEPFDETGGPKTLFSILHLIYFWETKLCEEVKTREGVRIRREKKLSTLRSRENRGEDQAKLDKTKVSIKKLQLEITGISQAVSTASDKIIDLRDSYLVPQLSQLCHRFINMWRSMNQYHERIQNHIDQQLQATKGDSTSELHRQAIRDLESAVTAWHSSFCRLIKFHRDFIRSLHGWFELSPISVTTENINGNRETSDARAFCQGWKRALESISDTDPSEAIKSFINVVHVISVKQTEELKMKKGTETLSKELEKKASHLRNIEKKYNGQVLGGRDPLAEKKSELAAFKSRVEDALRKHDEAVKKERTKTIDRLLMDLLSVFQALTHFSALYAHSLEGVCPYPPCH